MKKLLLALAVICLMAPASYALVINEWVSNDISTDDYEFIELCGTPNDVLDGLSIILIEGEGTGKGTIDRVIDLTGYALDANGYFVVGDPNVSPDIEMGAGFIENGGNTIVLVYGLQQAQGTDIDTDDDCIEDLPIGTVIDAVGYGYGYEADDCITYYGAVPVGPDGSYDPAGGARCCDCIGGWFMICLDGTEPTGPGCSLPDYEVGYATPGGPNDCLSVSSVEPAHWGGIKALYR
jgi:hypothetical protein